MVQLQGTNQIANVSCLFSSSICTVASAAPYSCPPAPHSTTHTIYHITAGTGNLTQLPIRNSTAGSIKHTPLPRCELSRLFLNGRRDLA